MFEFDPLAELRALLGGDRIDTFVVGTLLTLATVSAPVVAVLLVGYAVRAVRRRARGEGVPAFEDWRALSADGLRAAVPAALFHLPAAAVVAAVGFDRMLRGPSSLAYVGHYALSPDYGAVAAIAAVALLELAAGYLSVASLVAVARTGALGVDLPETVASVARDGRFVRAFGVALAVGFVARVARLAVGVVPFVGAPVGAFVAFVGLLLAASALAGVVDGDSGSDPLATALDGSDEGVDTDGRLSGV